MVKFTRDLLLYFIIRDLTNQIIGEYLCSEIWKSSSTSTCDFSSHKFRFELSVIYRYFSLITRPTVLYRWLHKLCSLSLITEIVYPAVFILNRILFFFWKKNCAYAGNAPLMCMWILCDVERDCIIFSNLYILI